jgi:endonuclease/exonuclease/phosphatase family metal-dependent hydrolase
MSLALAVGVDVAVGPVARPESGSGQARDNVTVITYNVRGLLRVTAPDPFVDPDPFRFTARVGTVVAERQADFVLLQEICGSQAQAIAEASRRKGHPMSLVAWDDFRNSEPLYEEARKVCENDEWPPGLPVRYGRAILSTQAGDIPIEPPPGIPCPEFRTTPCRALCIVEPVGRELRVCNLHVDQGELSYSPFDTWVAAGPLIVGGDFNTAPLEPSMATFYGSMFEADPSNAPTNGGPRADKKIDYIFADGVHFEAAASGDVLQMAVCSHPPEGFGWCSDHRMVIGEFPLSGVITPPPPSTEPAEPTADLYNHTYELDCRKDPPTSRTDQRRSSPSGPGPTQRYPLTDGEFWGEVHVEMVKIDVVDFDGDGQTEAAVLLECEGGLLGGGQGNDYLFAFKQTPQGWSQVGPPLAAWYIVYMGDGTYQSYDSCLLCGRPEYVEDPRLYKPTVWKVDPRNPPVFFATAHRAPVPIEQFPQDLDRWVGPCPCSPDTHPPDDGDELTL